MLSANDAWLRLLPSEFPLELIYWNIATIETVFSRSGPLNIDSQGTANEGKQLACFV